MNNTNNIIKNERITADTLRRIQNSLNQSIVSQRVDTVLNKVLAAVKMGATEYTLYTVAHNSWNNESIDEEEIIKRYIDSDELEEYKARDFKFKVEEKPTNNIVNTQYGCVSKFYKIILTW